MTSCLDQPYRVSHSVPWLELVFLPGMPSQLSQLSPCVQAPPLTPGLAQTLPSPCNSRCSGDSVPPPQPHPPVPSQGTEHFLPCFGTLWVHTLSCLFTCELSEGRAPSVCVLKSQPRARVELVA
ncbi:hypothetical protein ACRRTK_021379 [Alexandromys fortis]